jgi:hypothetical protein
MVTHTVGTGSGSPIFGRAAAGRKTATASVCVVDHISPGAGSGTDTMAGSRKLGTAQPAGGVGSSEPVINAGDVVVGVALT